MTSLAVMQPHYLPWCGYFDLMDQVDTFVLLDTAQFSRQSWQQRNRIRSADGLAWLTVPVLSKHAGPQPIDRVALRDDPRLVRAHLGSLQQWYRRAPGLGTVVDQLGELLRRGAAGGRLVDVTIPVLEWLRRELGVSTPVRRNSEIGCGGHRSEVLVALCREVGADRYLSPPGAVPYLVEDRHLFDAAGIEVDVHRYEHPEYPQQYRPFVSHASAVDLLLNVGDESLEVLRRGRRAPVPLAEVAA